MPIRFVALERERLPELVRFLCETMGKQANDATLDLGYLHWKYFEPLENWTGSRSYILEKDGVIVGHGGVCPFEFATAAGLVTSMQLVDWAASRKVPGAGVGLMRDAIRMTQTFLAIMGSEDTRRLIPKTPGFRRIEDNWIWSRSVRPFAQFTRYPRMNGRSVARMGRNIVQTLSSSWAEAGDWTGEPVAVFAQATISQPKQSITSLVRRASMIEYLRKRPGGKLRLYALKQSGLAVGLFLLCWFGGQCRVTDLWIETEAAGDYAAAYSVAFRTAADEPDTCEVVGCCATPLVQEAFLVNGLRRRWASPVYLHDRKNALADVPPLEINGMVGDLLYYYNPAQPFYS
jgi:hypothetical protein